MNISEILEYYAGNNMHILKKISYPIIIKIGGISELDYDDFYSIANYTLYDAIKNYDEKQNDNFDAFLRNCIKNKFLTEMTRRNRQRRIKSSEIDSLDRAISDDNDKTFGETIDSGFDIYSEIDCLSEEENVIRYINSLSPKQRKIAQLVIDGYEISEIKQILNIDEKKFNNCVDRMKTFDKRIILKSRY